MVAALHGNMVQKLKGPFTCYRCGQKFNNEFKYRHRVRTGSSWGWGRWPSYRAYYHTVNLCPECYREEIKNERLVDCSRNIATNFILLSLYPPLEIKTRPRPLEGVSEEFVIFQITGSDMVNHRLAAVPTAAPDGSSAEHTEQQLGLVKPRGVWRCITHLYPRGFQPLQRN